MDAYCDNGKTITVILPAPPEVDKISFLEKIKDIKYPPEKIEIIVAFGRNPSMQRNIAVSQSKGEIVLFLDDDSEPHQELLQKISDNFKDETIDGVGGPSLPHKKQSIIQSIFNKILSSSFGGFGISARYNSVGIKREACETDLILCNYAMRRYAFLKYGGLDERLYPNEENEFFNRIKKNGGKILYDPLQIVFRKSRSSYRQFFKQMYNYGRGRMEHYIVSPKFIEFKYFIPLLFLLYLSSILTMLITPNLRFINMYAFPLYAYTILSGFFSYKIYRSLKLKRITYFPKIVFGFFILHIGYGLGSLTGLFKGCYKKKFPKESTNGNPPVIHRYKELNKGFENIQNIELYTLNN